jgi:hypothetical protein
MRGIVAIRRIVKTDTPLSPWEERKRRLLHMEVRIQSSIQYLCQTLAPTIRYADGV